MFSDEMKDGLIEYISKDEIPLVQTRDVFAIIALVKLLASFMDPRFQSRADQIASSVRPKTPTSI